MKAVRLAGLAIAWILGQFAAAAETPPYPPPGKMIDLGGYRVHLNCTGTGEPAVMIVGAGYSFDWSLVQPAVTAFARVCTYDPPGTVWSDPGPAPTCDGRVVEIHKMLSNAGIRGPVVLVGHSIGAVFARLYAHRYPADVAGMVLIDHAGAYRFTPADAPLPQPGRSSVIQSGEASLSQLPAFAQDMHRWVSAQSASRTSNIPFFNACIAEVARTGRIQTAESMPLIVIANSALAGLPDYQSKQAELLAQSRNSKAMIARTRGHQVPIDDPGSIIEAIRQVVTAVRNHSSVQ
jgi:pimeloyl-ACP methyl ester carboxylesterase